MSYPEIPLGVDFLEVVGECHNGWIVRVSICSENKECVWVSQDLDLTSFDICVLREEVEDACRHYGIDCDLSEDDVTDWKGWADL